MNKEEVFKEIPKTGYQESSSFYDPEGFRRLVEARRAVRLFDQTPVPEAVMRDALELALLAPSSSNLQPAEFYWLRDAEKKRALAQACLSQPAATTAAELVVIVARSGHWRVIKDALLIELEKSPGITQKPLDYYRKIVPFAMTIGPFGILGKLKRLALNVRRLFKPTPNVPASIADLKVWSHTSAALAAQNLMLAVRAHGFDSCPMGGFDEARVKKILALPADADVLMVVSVGRRAHNGVYGPRMRMPSQHFIHQV